MSSLIKLLVVANAVDAHLLKELLEQEGIASVVRGDDILPLQGGHLFRMEVRPSVWVLDDERLPRAQAIAADYSSRGASSAETSETWSCPCGEVVETQFTECWSCGRTKPEA